MLQIVPCKCPNCSKMVTHLCFWRNIDGVAYYLCNKCVNLPDRTLNKFQIGYHYGYENHKQKLRDFLK